MPFLPPDDLGFDAPPAATHTALDDLERGLAGSSIPRKRNDNLLIATWNIRHFGRVQTAWESKPRVSPKRNLQDVCCIASVVSRFDVIALVEVKRDLTALRLLLRILGRDWAFIVSDVTEGDRGNSERLGYVFNMKRVRPSGLVGELVIPDDELKGAAAIMERQFARTPYTMSFRRGDKGFTLVTLHVYYATQSTPEKRTPELKRISNWLHDNAEDPDEFNRNLIALGDFNIDRVDDENWKAFVTPDGPLPPYELLNLPRTVGEKPGKNSYYDQIAWFSKGKRAALTLKYVTAGNFVWDDHLLKGSPVSEKEARISDHYPLWAEFQMDGA